MAFYIHSELSNFLKQSHSWEADSRSADPLRSILILFIFFEQKRFLRQIILQITVNGN
jgi:hypothetical protein